MSEQIKRYMTYFRSEDDGSVSYGVHESQYGKLVMFSDAHAAKDARIAELDDENAELRRMLGAEISKCNSMEALAERRRLPATPSEDGPEEMQFAYLHPNGERHTVTVSREEVLREMPDFLFEKLCGNFCQCEPVGETNVVECNCDEYAEEFQLLAAEPNAVTKEVAELRAQHSRIVAAKYAEIARLRELHENAHSAAKTLMAERATLMEQAAHWLEVNAPSGGCIETNIADELRAEAEQLRAQPARQVGGDERAAFTEAFSDNLDRYKEEFGDYDGEAIYEAQWEAWKARAALAPAAVVMPERLPLRMPQGRNLPANYAQAWNAALDEVARLNRRAIPVGLLESVLIELESGMLCNPDPADIAELRALLSQQQEGGV